MFRNNKYNRIFVRVSTPEITCYNFAADVFHRRYAKYDNKGNATYRGFGCAIKERNKLMNFLDSTDVRREKYSLRVRSMMQEGSCGQKDTRRTYESRRRARERSFQPQEGGGKEIRTDRQTDMQPCQFLSRIPVSDQYFKRKKRPCRPAKIAGRQRRMGRRLSELFPVVYRDITPAWFIRTRVTAFLCRG